MSHLEQRRSNLGHVELWPDGKYDSGHSSTCPGFDPFCPSETSSKNPVQKRVYVIKVTEFGTDPCVHYFSFFSHVDFEKVNCVSADIK